MSLLSLHFMFLFLPITSILPPLIPLLSCIYDHPLILQRLTISPRVDCYQNQASFKALTTES